MSRTDYKLTSFKHDFQIQNMSLTLYHCHLQTVAAAAEPPGPVAAVALSIAVEQASWTMIDD